MFDAIFRELPELVLLEQPQWKSTWLRVLDALCGPGLRITPPDSRSVSGSSHQDLVSLLAPDEANWSFVPGFHRIDRSLEPDR